MTESVLVVDDEPSILTAIEFIMKSAGFRVRTARDGVEALRALEEERPDLLLLDVMIPPPDGFDICQRIRAMPALKDLPIIMLTARGRDIEREKGLAMGADDYVTKPFSTRELMAKVRELLERRKRR
jgi:DNA-binding response OmpR family regulator